MELKDLKMIDITPCSIGIEQLMEKYKLLLLKGKNYKIMIKLNYLEEIVNLN